MKLRHTAAFALVGWYLMMPPIKGGDVNEGAPISHWGIISSYDTATECQNFLDAESKKTKANLPAEGQPPTNRTQRYALETELSACIASDDPRLAK
jgi:hypothetical protein